MKQILFIAVFGLIANLCLSQNNEINQVIMNAGKYADPVPSKDEKITTEISPTDGIKCNVKTVKLVKTFDQYITFNDIQDLFPGSIIQGRYLNEGKLVSIGNFSRQPITLIINGLDVMSKSIESPSKASISDALNEMVRNYKGNTSVKFEFNIVDAYSKKQALLDLGISGKWLTGSASGNLEVSSNKEEHTVFVYFKQAYYSVSVDFPSNPSQFFANDINIEDLKLRMNENNKPGYVSSVTYGRILVAKMTSTYSTEEMKMAAKAKFAGGLVNASVKADVDNVLASSKWEVQVSGGVSNSVPLDFNGVIDFINSGMNFTSSTQGVPIAYEVRYLSDNSPFVVSDMETYTIRECEKGAQEQTFKLVIDDVYVYKNCETFTDPRGEFTLKIYIDANGEVIEKAYEAECGTNKSCLSNISEAFKVPSKNGSYFEYKIILEEADYTASDQLTPTINKKIYFDAFNTVSTISGSPEVSVSSSLDFCRAKITYHFEKM